MSVPELVIQCVTTANFVRQFVHPRIPLVLEEHGLVSSDDTRGDGVVGTRTDDVLALVLSEELLCCQ